jgi:hypothetical protein
VGSGFCSNVITTNQKLWTGNSVNKRFIFVAVVLGLVLVLAAVFYWEGTLVFNQKTEQTPTPPPSITPTPTPSPAPTPKTFSNTTTATFDIPSSNYEVTYCANKTLAVNGQALWNPNCTLQITYSLDGADLHIIPCVIKPMPAMMGYAIIFSGTMDLSQLSAGEHTLVVYGKISWSRVSTAEATLNFIA